MTDGRFFSILDDGILTDEDRSASRAWLALCGFLVVVLCLVLWLFFGVLLKSSASV
jgi:hypothetical protein